MNVQHPDVQLCYVKNLSAITATRKVVNTLDDDTEAFALVGAYEWFVAIDGLDGRQGAKLQEILARLLSAELRPSLRVFFKNRAAANNLSYFVKFKDHLS